MRRPALPLLLLFYFCSCSGNSTIPKNVLNQTQMEAVLWDMCKADALGTEIIQKDTSKKLKNVSIELYQKVFASHHITRGAFDSSYSFYSNHLELMKTLFDTLNAQRERKSASLYQKPVVSSAKADSAKF